VSQQFLLDTNICVYVMNHRPRSVLAYFEQHKEHLAISSITLAELRFGAANSQHVAHNQRAIDEFCLRLDVLDFDAHAALQYGDIRATLKKQGQLIGDNDLLIAAHARSLNATLVTNNVREFERVAQLHVVNWV